MRYHLTPVRMAITTTAGVDVEKRESSYMLVGIDTTTMVNNMEVP